jgi:hypothetical protein
MTELHLQLLLQLRGDLAVMATNHRNLALQQWDTTNTQVKEAHGQIAARLDMQNVALLAILQERDDLATALAKEVKANHDQTLRISSITGFATDLLDAIERGQTDLLDEAAALQTALKNPKY